MAQELTVLKAPPPATPPAITELQAIEQIANVVSASNFVPKAYRGQPGSIIAAALTGREFGWSLMTSLQYIHVVDGRPSMSAEAMMARIRQLGHSVTVDEWSDEVCTLTGRHVLTGDTETVSFTMEDAQRAGLHTKDNWRKYPKAMLRARATTMLARALFADAIMGISYTPEELGAVDVEVVSEEAAPPAAAPAAPPAPAAPAESEPAPAAEKPKRRRKVDTPDRCKTCDGYGAGADPKQICPACKGTGAEPSDITPVEMTAPEPPPTTPNDSPLPAPEIAPDAPADAEPVGMPAACADIPLCGYVYRNAVAENEPGEPLSSDVALHLQAVMIAGGYATDAAGAAAKVNDIVAKKGAQLNEWAYGQMRGIVAQPVAGSALAIGAGA